MNEWNWFVLDVNPEPWAIGDLSVGRAKGKVYPKVARNQQLWYYQQAVKEAIGETDLWFEGYFELMFLFWRNRAEYSTSQARTHRKHEADVTNLQKATEDALQGVLFKNDKDTCDIRSRLVAQGSHVKGKIVIAIRSHSQPSYLNLPADVLAQIEEIDHAISDTSWNVNG